MAGKVSAHGRSGITYGINAIVLIADTDEQAQALADINICVWQDLMKPARASGEPAAKAGATASSAIPANPSITSVRMCCLPIGISTPAPWARSS